MPLSEGGEVCDRRQLSGDPTGRGPCWKQRFTIAPLKFWDDARLVIYYPTIWWGDYHMLSYIIIYDPTIFNDREDSVNIIFWYFHKGVYPTCQWSIPNEYSSPAKSFASQGLTCANARAWAGLPSSRTVVIGPFAPGAALHVLRMSEGTNSWNMDVRVYIYIIYITHTLLHTYVHIYIYIYICIYKGAIPNMKY